MRLAFIIEGEDKSVHVSAEQAEQQGHQVIIWQFHQKKWWVGQIRGPMLATGLPRQRLSSLQFAWQPDRIISAHDKWPAHHRKYELSYPAHDWLEKADGSIDVSVITPTMNAAHLILPCIQSVAVQLGVSFEHIIVDGGSTDGTGEIVNSGVFATKWKSSKDSGIAEAFNKGTIRSQGRYLMFIGADDRLRPGALRALHDCLSRNPDAGFVHAGCGYLLNGTIVEHGRPNTDYRRLLPIRASVIHPTTMARREIFAHAGLFQTRWRFAMDHDVILRWDRCGIVGTTCDQEVIDIGLGGLSTRMVVRARRESAEVAITHGLPKWRSHLACTLDSLRPLTRNAARVLIGRSQK